MSDRNAHSMTTKISTMKYSLSALTIGAIIMTAVTACDDNVTTLGSSLVDNNSRIVIDSTFTITGRSLANNDLPSRTITQTLGVLNAKEYGSFSADFVTQFMPAMKIDTAGVKVSDIDSVKMMMFFAPGDFTGDSIVPMGLKVYPLTRQLTAPIYSDFDPTGYYDENNCWTTPTQIYTANALYNDSINNLAYRTVSVKLPLNFATDFYNQYIDHPETFATPQAFAKFFPGLYVKNSFGSGRVINFNETRINFYFKRHAKVTKNGVTRDTVYNQSASYMAVSPEVISNNIINMSISSSLTSMINSGEVILVAPASYDAQLVFPTREILSGYKANAGDMAVINALSLSIPASTITNNYKILPPANVLLVLKKDKKEFFANNKIADDKTSFLASYNSQTKTYDFTGMRQYILDMLAKDNLTADDYTFIITPVNVTYENSQSGYYQQAQAFVQSITPYISGPAMCKLDLEKAKIKFTYSKQSIKN